MIGSEMSSSFSAISPRAEPKIVPPIRSKARGTTFPQKEIGPMITTSVMSGQVPSGMCSNLTRRKVRMNANAMRQPCTTR
ncbi:hypothetical protein D3C71_1614430 [compost metagenome]